QLSVIDGDKGNTDYLRMQVWNRHGAIIYDNQPDDEVDAEATMAIDRGAIVIHKSKKDNEAVVSKGQPLEGFSAYPVPISRDGLWLKFPPLEKEGTLQVLINHMTGRKMAEKQFKSGKVGS